MKFYSKKTDFIYEGKALIENGCLYFSPLHICNSVISFGDYSLQLKIDTERKTIVSLEGFVSIKTAKEKELNIPIAENAEIYFKNEEHFPKWKKYVIWK
jgi:hypothetical protein